MWPRTASNSRLCESRLQEGRIEEERGYKKKTKRDMRGLWKRRGRGGKKKRISTSVWKKGRRRKGKEGAERFGGKMSSSDPDLQR